MTELALGIDIGGTNTVFGLIDKEGYCHNKNTLSTIAFLTPELLIEAVKTEVDLMLDKLPNFKLVGIGIGAPNGNYFNGTIEYAPNLIWKGIIDLVKLLKVHYDLPIYVNNDANAATIGEMTYGAAKHIRDFVLVTLGTGLGSGFVSNGQLIYGHDGFGGELGHVIIEPEGRDCGCNRKGCLETYASATGLVKTAILKLKTFEGNSTLKEMQPEELDAKTIAEAAQKQDSLAIEIFDYTAQKLALGLANAVAITNPKTIILYGGLAKAGDILLKPLVKYFESYLLEIFKNKVNIIISDLDNDNGAILGASALVWNELKQIKRS